MADEPFRNEFKDFSGNFVQAERIEHLHMHASKPSIPDGPGVREHFTGRERELAQITEALAARRPVCVHGEEGSGRTALADKLLERARGDYPDGAIYIDHDHHQSSTAMVSALMQLDVAAEVIPETLEGRASLYQAALRRRRTLVVLDGATRPREIELFRPYSSECGYAVFADRPQRDHEWADIELGPLTADEAAAFLQRTCPNLDAAVTPLLAEEFGGRPATLRALAGLIRHRSLTSLTAIHAAVGDSPIASELFAGLSESARWLYRLLDSLPNGEFERALTGIFTGTTGWAAGSVPAPLTELIDAQLASEHRPGWYRLERAVAGRRERTDPRDPVPIELFNARKASLTWHIARAQHADRAVIADRARFAPDFTSRTDAPRFDGPAEALEWFRTLHSALSVSVRIAAEHRWSAEAWALAEALFAYFTNAKQHREAVDCYRSALAVAASPAAEAQLSALLGLGLIGVGDPIEAEQVLARGLDAAAEARTAAGRGRYSADWPWLISIVNEQLARLRLDRGRLDEATMYIEAAIANAEEIGRDRSIGICLRVLAEIRKARGDRDGAAQAWRDAAERFTTVDDQRNLVGTRLDLAMLRLETFGEEPEALAEIDALAAQAHRDGWWQLAAETHERVAARLAPGTGRRERLETALRLFEASGAILDADRVRRLLREI